MPLHGFKFVKGKPNIFKRSDIKKAFSRLFCGNCGTSIGSKHPNRPKFIILKVGAFDDPFHLNLKLQFIRLKSKNFILYEKI